jgi:hypothetical protein
MCCNVLLLYTFLSDTPHSKISMALTMQHIFPICHSLCLQWPLPWACHPSRQWLTLCGHPQQQRFLDAAAAGPQGLPAKRDCK